MDQYTLGNFFFTCRTCEQFFISTNILTGGKLTKHGSKRLIKMFMDQLKIDTLLYLLYCTESHALQYSLFDYYLLRRNGQRWYHLQLMVTFTAVKQWSDLYIYIKYSPFLVLDIELLLGLWSYKVYPLMNSICRGLKKVQKFFQRGRSTGLGLRGQNVFRLGPVLAPKILNF